MHLATERRNDYAAQWDRFLVRYQSQLRSCATYLLPCGCSEHVVKQVEAEAIEVAVLDRFKRTFSFRTLVKAVIKHIGECTYGTRPRYTDSAFEISLADENLPTYERIAYCLRQTLKCQTRDASLLMGVSDAQVEALLSFTRKRLEATQALPRSETHLGIGTASVEIGLPCLGAPSE